MALRGYSIQQTAIGTTSYVAVTGLRRVALGFKGLYVAMGPIGWAVVGLTAAYEVFAYNIFGARDALHWLTEEIIKLFPFLEGLRELVHWIFPDDAAANADAMAGAVADTNEALQGYAVTAEHAAVSTDGVSASVVGLSAQMTQAAAPLKGSKPVCFKPRTPSRSRGTWRAARVPTT